jgi:hypothetical protein
MEMRLPGQSDICDIMVEMVHLVNTIPAYCTRQLIESVHAHATIYDFQDMLNPLARASVEFLFHF